MCVGEPIIVSTNIKRLATYVVASHPHLLLPNDITYYHVVNSNIKRLTTYVWNRIIAESRRTDTYIASCDVLPIIIGDPLKRRHNTKKRRHNTTSLPLFLPMSGQPHHQIRATTRDRPYGHNQFHRRILQQLRIMNYAL